MTRFRAAVLAALLVPSMLARATPAAAQDAGPVIVVETSAGTFAFETFPDEAPKTVAHILELVRERLLRRAAISSRDPGIRRAMGRSADEESREVGGLGSGDAASSGKPVGVSEMNKKRLHVKGAVGVAHLGDPAKADSQIYVTLAARPDLNGRYTVFGRMIAGTDVPERIQKGDQITRMYVRE